MPSLDIITGMSMPCNHHAVAAFRGGLYALPTPLHIDLLIVYVCRGTFRPITVRFVFTLALLGTLPPPRLLGSVPLTSVTPPTPGLTTWTPPPPPRSHQCHPAAPSVGVHRHLVVHPTPWQWTHSLGDRRTIPTKIGREGDLWPVCGDAGANGGQHQSPPISAVCPRHISNPDARTITPKDERS